MDTKKPLQIAVVGDIHGHITLTLLLLREWEKRTKKTLDLILQVGDFGIWPHPSVRIDKATKRFSEKDPEEISFKEFYDGSSPFAYHFFASEQATQAPIICIHGNHEDFRFLNSISRQEEYPVPLDYYKRIFYIPNGKSFLFQQDGQVIHIAGIGGLETNHPEYGFTEKEINRLYGTKHIDILLTHQAPSNLGEEGCSPKVQSLIESIEPTYHFCGHHHIPGRQITQRKTKSYILNEVNFETKTRLKPSSIGILSWQNPKKSTFCFLNEEWFNNYTRKRYNLEKEQLTL